MREDWWNCTPNTFHLRTVKDRRVLIVCDNATEGTILIPSTHHALNTTPEGLRIVCRLSICLNDIFDVCVGENNPTIWSFRVGSVVVHDGIESA